MLAVLGRRWRRSCGACSVHSWTFSIYFQAREIRLINMYGFFFVLFYWKLKNNSDTNTNFKTTKNRILFTTIILYIYITSPSQSFGYLFEFLILLCRPQIYHFDTTIIIILLSLRIIIILMMIINEKKN